MSSHECDMIASVFSKRSRMDRVPPPSPCDYNDEEPIYVGDKQVVLIMPGHRDTAHTKHVPLYHRGMLPTAVETEDNRRPVNYESGNSLAQVMALWQSGVSGGVTVKQELQRSAEKFEAKPLTEVVNYLNRRKSP